LGLVSPSSLFSPVHSEAKAKKEVVEDESGDGETVPKLQQAHAVSLQWMQVDILVLA
jgi:hypothetical protein